MDKIRIADVWDGGDVVYLKGDAASAYYDELGLKKFDRHFIYIKPDKFIVFDEIGTDEPSISTFMLNADRAVELNERGAGLINDGVSLSLTRLLPSDVRSEIVDQTVQARGLPGSVAKGDMEIRGKQLRITSGKRSSESVFLNFLSVNEAAYSGLFPKASLADKEGAVVAINNGDGTTDRIYLKGNGEDIRTDASFAIVRTDGSGRPLMLAAHKARFLSLTERDL